MLLKVIVKGNLALQLNLCIKCIKQNLMELGLLLDLGQTLSCVHVIIIGIVFVLVLLID